MAPLKELKSQLLLLQSAICTNITIGDANVEIIEIVFDDKQPGRTYYPLHSHTWFEFNYLTSGRMVTILNNVSFAVNTGQFFLIPPETEHAHCYNPKETPHEGICIRWKLKKDVSGNEQGRSYALFNNLKDWRFHALPDTYAIGALLAQMFDEVSRGFDPISLQLNFIKIITILAEINKTTLYLPKPEKDYAQRSLIKKIEVYLNDNLKNNFGVHDIAASLHLSYGYLARIYKKYTGETIIDRLNRIKMDKALHLLENPEMSIKEIAEMSGFANQYYFSNLFKKKFGISPRKYRSGNCQSYA